LSSNAVLTPIQGEFFSNCSHIHSGALNNDINNKNFLSPLNFSFSIKRAPHIEFFIQKINLPGFVLNSPAFATPFVNIPEVGDHLNYGTLKISFKVDEDLQNYLEIHRWLKGLGKPKEFHEYRHLSEKPQFIGYGLKSDISLVIMSNIKNPNYKADFIDAFPIALSGLQFDTTNPDINYLIAEAEFKYVYYDIERIL
jgi:hypothetical protein